MLYSSGSDKDKSSVVFLTEVFVETSRLEEKKFYKITDSSDCENGIQIQTGLNIWPEPFKKANSKKKNGFYFSEIKDILRFSKDDTFIRIVELPLTDSDFKCILDQYDHNAWRSNKIIFGERMTLSDVPTFEYLESKGVSIDKQHCFSWACEKGYLNVVKFFFETGVNICSSRNYALRTAASNGHSDVVAFLIEKGAKVSDCDNFAIRHAATKGHKSVVELLIKHGADGTANEDEAVVFAAMHGHLETVKILMKSGAKFKNRIKRAIYWATLHGYFEIVEFLVNEYTDGKATDCFVGHAASNGDLKMVQFLVDRGANIHEEDDAAIRWASRRGYLSMVKYLVEKGADIRAKDDYAVKQAHVYQHWDVVDFLVENGAPKEYLKKN